MNNPNSVLEWVNVGLHIWGLDWRPLHVQVHMKSRVQGAHRIAVERDKCRGMYEVTGGMLSGKADDDWWSTRLWSSKFVNSSNLWVYLEIDCLAIEGHCLCPWGLCFWVLPLLSLAIYITE